MKRYNHLFEKITSYENISLAIDEVNRTHHWRSHHRINKCTVWVETTKEERIKELQQIITNGFEQSPPKEFKQYDVSAQKWRTIKEPRQYPDQYVHHALIQVLIPIFMRGMDKCCCGSIPGRGTSKGQRYIRKWVQHHKTNTKYCLSADIYHFYESIQPRVVMDRMRQLIKDSRTLDLIERIIKDGIFIGAYPSQWFANTVLQPLDQLIREDKSCRYYLRYMDNFTIFGRNKRKLHRMRIKIVEWLSAHSLTMKGDWQVFRVDARSPNALGFRFWRDRMLPRKRTFLRLKRQLARYRKRRDKGKPIPVKMAAGLLSRIGQLKYCNNYNLYILLFKGEKIQKQLKDIVRKESVQWIIYSVQMVQEKFLKQKVQNIPT